MSCSRVQVPTVSLVSVRMLLLLLPCVLSLTALQRGSRDSPLTVIVVCARMNCSSGCRSPAMQYITIAGPIPVTPTVNHTATLSMWWVMCHFFLAFADSRFVDNIPCLRKKRTSDMLQLRYSSPAARLARSDTRGKWIVFVIETLDSREGVAECPFGSGRGTY
jgi:hypothetical protein